MRLDEAIRQFLDTVGLEEIALRPAEGEDKSCFRATATVRLRDGQIGNEVDVERLTWGTLPTGRHLRISALEIENRTEDELRVALELHAPPTGVASREPDDDRRRPERRRAGDGVDIGLGTWTW